MAEILDRHLHGQLKELMQMSVEERMEHRYQKYRNLGQFEDLS